MKSKVLTLIVIGLIAANIASADLVTCRNDCEPGDLIYTIKLIINTLLSWAALVSMLFIVISGFKMILSRGNEEAISNAKTSMGYAIGGFIVIMLSFVILNFVVGVLTGGGEINNDGLDEAFDLFPNPSPPPTNP